MSIPCLTRMPLTVSIEPFSDLLDMYGDADSSSTFSLSGHVSVSLTSPSSLFARRRAPRHILLQSLTITFEGQSEVLSSSTGYVPVRLCSITRELLPGGPVELPSGSHDDFEQPCLWNIVFDIPVPGWLPTTSVYGDASLQAAGTSYALYATATFIDTNHDRFPFSIVNICKPARSCSCTVDAHRCSITLRRYIEPLPGSSSSTFPMIVYAVDSHLAPDSEDSPQESIPNGILEKIQVVASLPSATAIDEVSLPFVLRFRGIDWDYSEGKQLRITEFSVDVEQVEVYRKTFSHDDVDQFPIPSQSCQPPHVPLRDPHPIRTLYDSGFLGAFGSSVKRSFSILAPTESGRYIISGDGHILNHGPSSSVEEGWYVLEAKIPILTEPYARDWAGARKRRITERSPLFSVEHHMHVVVHGEYSHGESGETVPMRLNFSLPMRHVDVPETPPTNVPGDRCEGVRKTLPRKQSLPAYSQLFHSNGERKIDYSVPLPLYEPPSPWPSGTASNRQAAP